MNELCQDMYLICNDGQLETWFLVVCGVLVVGVLVLTFYTSFASDEPAWFAALVGGTAMLVLAFVIALVVAMVHLVLISSWAMGVVITIAIIVAVAALGHLARVFQENQ